MQVHRVCEARPSQLSQSFQTGCNRARLTLAALFQADGHRGEKTASVRMIVSRQAAFRVLKTLAVIAGNPHGGLETTAIRG